MVVPGCTTIRTHSLKLLIIIIFTTKKEEMGNDGGSIAKRSEMVKMQKKKLQRMKEGQKA